MNEPTLKKIHAELSDLLIDQKFGKIFPLTKLQLAIDFRLKNGRYLFLSVEPTAPRIYLIKRKLKELEKKKTAQPTFVSFLRKRLANATLTDIKKIVGERILRFSFTARSELGEIENFFLIVQLTGRSSNIFILNEREFILDSIRETFGPGQEIATRYAFPESSKLQNKKEWEVFPKGDFSTLSESLDSFYLKKEASQKLQSKIQSARSSISRELKKKKRLRNKLLKDLESHGVAGKWKHFGDLLLANIATAKRKGNKVLVTDYFDEKTPEVEIEVAENLSLSEGAEKYFKKYTKARNAKKEINKRLLAVKNELEEIEKKKIRLEQAIKNEDLDRIEIFLEKKQRPRQKTKKNKTQSTNSVAREFISTDGFEILVGKRSKDNDYLTFRIAKSLDTWLHAADYPGSHVIIRNPNRKEIPNQTLIEAAQLAAFYSKAKKESKVGVHYTQKKFVNKPKGAAAGLVRLQSFKTLLVKPQIKIKKKE